MAINKLIRTQPDVAEQIVRTTGKLAEELIDVIAELDEVVGPAMQVRHLLAQFAPQLFDWIARGGVDW